MALLITGATGIVGSELVRTLLADPGAPHLLLLIRGSDAEVDAKVLWLRRWVGDPHDWDERVRIVRGDVCEEGFGDDVRGDVTGVLHAAASTSFGQSDAQAQRQNVDGLRNTLALARRCPRLERFGLLSTVFVAGERSGTIREGDLDLEVGFANAYERSKAEGEALAAASGLPVATYRLSVVVGRRDDGRIARMSGVYPVWRILHRGQLAMVPGDPAQRVDLVPVDYAADAVAHLFQRAFRSGARYHVAAGSERSLPLEELLDAFAEAIGRVDPRWRLHGYPKPASVSSETFARFADTVERVAQPALRGTVRQLRLFTRQLEFPKRFDTAELERDLAGSGIALAPAREWIPALAAYALNCDFRAPGWADA
jgi:nucleoside-diphosphate-sugar epimerase